MCERQERLAGGGSDVRLTTWSIYGRGIETLEIGKWVWMGDGSVVLRFEDGFDFMPTACQHSWQPLNRDMPDAYLCLRCGVKLSAEQLNVYLKGMISRIAQREIERSIEEVSTGAVGGSPTVEELNEQWKRRLEKMDAAYRAIIDELKFRLDQALQGQRLVDCESVDTVPGITSAARRKVRVE